VGIRVVLRAVSVLELCQSLRDMIRVVGLNTIFVQRFGVMGVRK
jgi:hypothetical protein